MAEENEQFYSGKIRKEDIKAYKKIFESYDKDASGFVDKFELPTLLNDLDIKISNAVLREEINVKYGDEIDFDEFIQIVTDYSSAQDGAAFLMMLKKRKNVEKTGGSGHASHSETTHSFDESEVAAFAGWINTQLENDKSLKGSYIPIDSSPKSRDLFVKSGDGVLLCKLINDSVPHTIDERVINFDKKDTFSKHENLTLAINSAKSIGCQIVNIGPDDISSGKPHLVLGMMWQIIRIGLFSHITFSDVPGLRLLLESDEDVSVLHKLTPEELLIRWVNYHLRAANCHRVVKNFSDDIQDSEVYYYLLLQVAPDKIDLKSYSKIEFVPIDDHLARAEYVLQMAEKMECRKFVRAKDIVEGNAKLNLAFVANLFNHHPGLSTDESRQQKIDPDQEETPEDKMYRNWMNSLGVSPFVTWLFTDLCDGTVLLQLFHFINKDLVSALDVKMAKQTVTSRLGATQRMLINCNACVKHGKNLGCSLPAIDGKNIFDGDVNSIRCILWQMMNVYTMKLVSSLTSDDNLPIENDFQIIKWVQKELKSGGKKTTIASFKDYHSISTSKPVIDLVDVISRKRLHSSTKHSIVRYELVTDGETEEDKMKNAIYALSLARKIGAQIYALPEHLVEVHPKMVKTIFVCLMACDPRKAKDRRSQAPEQISRGRKF